MNGEYFKCVCPECGWRGSSKDAAGGGSIADTGDYDDIYCPQCINVGGLYEGRLVSLEEDVPDEPDSLSDREVKAYNRLRDHVTRPKDRFERIENGVLVGMPDCNYCILGSEGWIEIKAPYAPRKEKTALFSGNHPFSQEQSNWMLKQSNAGGRSFLFIACELKVMLIAGSRACRAPINEMTLAELCECSLWVADVPVRVPELWFDLRQILIDHKG